MIIGPFMFRIAAVTVAVLAVSMPARAGDYRLGPGDFLEFTIAGVSDLTRKVPIGVDGLISLPLIGEVPAAGRTLTELRADVRGLIGQKEVRQRDGAGGSPEVIWPDQVSLDVAEFRPVYLDGDVAKPGEQKFRPGMTVRQALSLAGGFDILRFRMDNPFIEASELRGSYEGAWIDYAREQARLSRLRAELGEGGTSGAGEGSTPPLPSVLLSQLKTVETATLKVRMDDYSKQTSHLANLLGQQDANIAVLIKTHDAESSGTQYDEAEFKRIDELYKQGTLPMVRVAEARRVMLLSATQALQSQAELERARTDRELTRRKRESLDDDRRKELLAQLQDSQTKMAAVRARVSAIGDKLLYVGALKSQLVRGAAGGGVSITLHRPGQTAIPVDQDAELQPGDVLDISLKPDNDGALPSGLSMR